MTHRTRAGVRLGYALQVRFTEQQRDLLQAVADQAERPISAIVRDVVTVWAINHQVDVEAVTPDQVLELVAELQAHEDDA